MSKHRLASVAVSLACAALWSTLAYAQRDEGSRNAAKEPRTRSPIHQYATLDSPHGVTVVARAIEDAYSKFAYYARAGRAYSAKEQQKAYRIDDDLRFDIRILDAGSFAKIAGKSLDEVVSPLGGRRLNVGVVSRRFKDEEDHRAHNVTWRDDPYLGSIVEDWSTPVAAALQRASVNRSFDGYVTYEVTAHMDGLDRNYRALLLRDSTAADLKSGLTFVDNVVGPGILEESLRASDVPLYAKWGDYIRTRAANEDQPASRAHVDMMCTVCEVCMDGFCCDNSYGGMCDPTGCGFADPFACGPLIGPPPEPIGSITCQTSDHANSFDQSSSDPTRSDHSNFDSGNHGATSRLTGRCQTFEDCTQTCQVTSTAWSPTESGFTLLYIHNHFPKQEFADGTNQCSGINFTGLYGCLLGFCSASITVEKKDVAGITINAPGSLWSFSHMVSYGGTNCPAPVRNRLR